MLHRAVERSNWHELKTLLNLSYINVNERDNTQQTPLHAVSTIGHKQMAEILLAKGADVNAVDANRWAPIHCAASNGHLDLVDLLLDQPSIDVSIPSKDGTSMFHYLMRYQPEPQLEVAYYNVLRKSIQLGVDVTLHGKHLETPLHQATIRCNVAAIQFLLENGAHIDAQNKFGETALHYAVRAKNRDLVQFLLDQEADMSVRSRDGTPLDIADDEGIKSVLNGDRSQTSLLSNRFTSNVGLREKKEAISSLRTETSEVESEETIDEEQLKKVQEHMLQYYITEAYKKKDGPPSSLPIFCNNCYRPFTYPIGAISIKCPMCLSVNIIPKREIAGAFPH